MVDGRKETGLPPQATLECLRQLSPTLEQNYHFPLLIFKLSANAFLNKFIQHRLSVPCAGTIPIHLAEHLSINGRSKSCTPIAP